MDEIFWKRRISTGAVLKTNFGNHLEFRRHFEFLKKVYVYKSLVIGKESEWKLIKYNTKIINSRINMLLE
jgi:hypothetical protein